MKKLLAFLHPTSHVAMVVLLLGLCAGLYYLDSKMPPDCACVPVAPCSCKAVKECACCEKDKCKCKAGHDDCGRCKCGTGKGDKGCCEK